MFHCRRILWDDGDDQVVEKSQDKNSAGPGKKLKREQRRLSRKYESLKAKNKETKGEATRRNIHKQTIKVQKLHQRLFCIRENHIHQGIRQVIKEKPGLIITEELYAKVYTAAA